MKHSSPPAGSSGSRDGQALVEFIVAIVAILALVAGMLQVASLTRTHSDTMVEARKEAGEAAMLDLPQGSVISASPDYIRDWAVGPDKKLHTKDDVASMADAGQFSATVVDQAVRDAPVSDWPAMSLVPNNPFVSSGLRSGTPNSAFGFVQGSDSRSVPLLPAAQHLYYRAESIDVKCDVWMTWTKGIY